MSYTTRYQVFLSSTFTDLKEERGEVIQALWELDCIPTGMEAFLASNEGQWQVIQRVIDECDYYVLIIGGRYGSITSDGLSYTEREFRYAVEIGLPILAFIHGDPQTIPVGKSDATAEAKEQLAAFRQAVMERYPVRTWTTAHELGGLVSRSLIQEIRRNPRPGWIRNDGKSPVSLMERIDVLTQENAALRAASDNSAAPVPVEELAGGTDRVRLHLLVTYIDGGKRHNVDCYASASWDDIFRDFGPALLNEASEKRLRNLLSRFYSWDKDKTIPHEKVIEQDAIQETFGEVIVQFRALGFIQRGTKRRGVSDKENYWALTAKGEAYLIGLLAIRRAPQGEPESQSAATQA